MGETKAASVKIAVAIVALVAAAVIVVLQMGGKRTGPPQEAYYYDLGSGQVFAGPSGELPIDAPSGSQGVRAHVVSCGACEAGEWTVLSIRSYTPEAQRVLSGPAPEPGDARGMAAWDHVVSEGQLIAIPPEAGGEVRWIPFGKYTSPDFRDPTATALRERAENLCGGESFNVCAP